MQNNNMQLIYSLINDYGIKQECTLKKVTYMNITYKQITITFSIETKIFSNVFIALFSLLKEKTDSFFSDDSLQNISDKNKQQLLILFLKLESNDLFFLNLLYLFTDVISQKYQMPLNQILIKFIFNREENQISSYENLYKIFNNQNLYLQLNFPYDFFHYQLLIRHEKIENARKIIENLNLTQLNLNLIITLFNLISFNIGTQEKTIEQNFHQNNLIDILKKNSIDFKKLPMNNLNIISFLLDSPLCLVEEKYQKHFLVWLSQIDFTDSIEDYKNLFFKKILIHIWKKLLEDVINRTTDLLELKILKTIIHRIKTSLVQKDRENARSLTVILSQNTHFDEMINFLSFANKYLKKIINKCMQITFSINVSYTNEQDLIMPYTNKQDLIMPFYKKNLRIPLHKK